MSGSEETTAIYEMVEDDNELDYLLSVFAELLENDDSFAKGILGKQVP